MTGFGSSNKREKRTYRFSVLHYQRKMWGRGDAQPVAVIATGREGTCMMGIHPSNMEGTSEIGHAVLGQLPHILMEQLREAEQAEAEDVIGFIASRNQWNLYLSDPETLESTEHLYTVCFQVFLERVIDFYKYSDLNKSSLPSNPLDHIFMRGSDEGSFRPQKMRA